MRAPPATWHHGLIARWWGEFNKDGEDIAGFQRLIEESGEPALDLACGAGRLLVPFLRAGLDVDGCDLSDDMLAHCRAYAEAEGLSPRLFRQATSELDLPRRYRTIVVCGSFGIGGDRRDDLEGLRRAHGHLVPGGTLAFDLWLPNAEPVSWSEWLPGHRPELPAPWPDRGKVGRAADGTTLEIKTRVRAFDPLEQFLIREIRVEHRSEDGDLIAREERPLRINAYFKNEVALMLEVAGFREVDVRAGLEDRPPEPYRDVHLTFVARR